MTNWRRSGEVSRMSESRVPAVTLARTIRAPAATVYRAWHDPELMRGWLASGDWKVGAVRTDPRVGGAFMFEVVSPEDDVHRTRGEYLELVRDARIVMTWGYEGPHGNDEEPSELTVEMRAVDARTTELTLTHRRARDEKIRELLVVGWASCMDAMQALLEGRSG